MEITEITDSQTPPTPNELTLLQDAQYALHSAGKWANFLAIMGFIGSGLVILCGAFAGLMMSTMSALGGMASRFPSALGGIVSVLYIGGGVIYFIISLNLYRFAGSMKTGIEFQSAGEVSKGLQNLRVFFKWKGVMLIVILSLYVLMIIGFIIIAASGMPSIYNPGHAI